jgi:hypothetical protein
MARKFKELAGADEVRGLTFEVDWRNMMTIEYIIEKSPVPILFIDTFALIDYGKGCDERITEILDVASQKVKMGKLICPTGDQIEEVDKTEYAIIKRKAVSSFYDMKFATRKLIRGKQLLSFLKHYKERTPQVTVSFKEGFGKDPICELKELIAGAPCIYFDEPLPEEVAEIDRLSRKNLVRSFTDWHEEKGRLDFEQQIIEYPKAKRQKVIDYINELRDKTDNNSNAIDYWLQVQDADYGLFKKIFPDGSINYYLNFIESDWYRYIPWQYIAIHIVAGFFSKESKKPMGNGEPMDIEHISAYMPYCDYMLIDFEQCRLLKKYKLDELYKTQVFTMKTHKDLLAVLEAI